jgi:hypothetical protein
LPEDVGRPEDWRITETLQRVALAEPDVPPLKANDPIMRVAVGVPMERTIMQEAFFGFVQIFQQGWSMARLPYCRNDIARHKMCQFLLNGPYTHLLMLDSDHVHPADIVQRLARWFQAYPDKIQVIGGLNFRRGEPYDPCAFVDPGDGHYHRLAAWERGAIAVDVVGSGSIMIAREVLEQMPEDEGWWDYAYADHSGWPGTDMTFARKCREHGIQQWVDTTTVSPHIGTMMIDEGTYRGWLSVKQAELAAQPNEMEVRLQ